jgi:hypothetical protein
MLNINFNDGAVILAILAGLVNLLTFYLVGRLFSKTKTYQEKLGQYQADLDILPKLTHEIEAIKSEFSQAQNLKIGIKAMERDMIIEMIESFAKSYHFCVSLNKHLSTNDINILNKLLLNHIETLEYVFVTRAKFKAICHDKKLVELSADLQNKIVDHLIAPSYEYLGKMHVVLNKISKFDGVEPTKPPSNEIPENHKYIDDLTEYTSKISQLKERYIEVRSIKDTYSETLDKNIPEVRSLLDSFLVQSGDYLRGLLASKN